MDVFLGGGGGMHVDVFDNNRSGIAWVCGG